MIFRNIFLYIILVFSFIIHEFAHAFIAYTLSDSSDELKDRLTLNPIKHMDLMGSVLLPLILIFSNSTFLIGWAKPVKIDITQFKNPYKDFMLTAIAGPLMNLLLAIIFIIILKTLAILSYINNTIYSLFILAILLNIILCIFNLLPAPPLDGSRVVFYFLPNKYKQIYLKYGGILLILFFILIFMGFLSPFLNTIIKFINSIVL